MLRNRATAGMTIVLVFLSLTSCGDDQSPNRTTAASPVAAASDRAPVFMQADAAIVEGDRPSYSTAVALNRASDVVVVGTVGEVLTREMDEGSVTPGPNDISIPAVFVNVTVDEVVKGQLRDGDNLAVSTPPDSGMDLVPGSRVALFMRQVEKAPGIQTQDRFYVPVSGPNAMLDVSTDGRSARTRTDELRGLLKPNDEGNLDADGSGRLVLELTRLLAALDQPNE